MDSPTQRKATAGIAPVKYYTNGHGKVAVGPEVAYTSASDLRTCRNKKITAYGIFSNWCTYLNWGNWSVYLHFGDCLKYDKMCYVILCNTAYRASELLNSAH